MEITLKEIKELFSSNSNEGKETTTSLAINDSHWNIGANYFIRTVTMYHVGNLEKVTDKELVLTNAAWIADAGKFSEAINNANFSEVELFRKNKPVIVGRGALVDAQEIEVDLSKLITK